MFRPDIYYNKDMTKKITAPVEEKDFILSFITSTLDFCKQNKKGVLTALGILVLAAVIGFAYSTHVKNVTEKLTEYEEKLKLLQKQTILKETIDLEDITKIKQEITNILDM